MIIDKQGKLFGKISIIDIVALLMIAALAFGLYSRFVSPARSQAPVEKQQIEYTLSVQEVPLGTVEALSKSGAVSTAPSGEFAGNVTDVTYTESVKSVILSDGTMVEVPVPERFDAAVKVSAEVTADDTGYYIEENQPISIGTVLNFTTKFVKTSGTVVDIKEIQQ